MRLARVSKARTPPAGSQGGLARLWGVSARAELVSRYQLVTLFSGAVVLETQQQYAEHGLTPADGNAAPSVPNVPVPSTGLLVIFATAAAMLRRRRAIDMHPGDLSLRA